MAEFDDLDQYFSPGLTLTVQGKKYRVPLPDAELGLWCRRVAQTAGEVFVASTDEMGHVTDRAVARFKSMPDLPGDLSFEERLLGTAYAEMMADRVPDPHVKFCAQTAFYWIVGGEETAERYWKSGGHPEAPGPRNRAERRAQQSKTITDADTATRSPGSTSGTSSRRRSRRNGRRPRTPGQTS